MKAVKAAILKPFFHQMRNDPSFKKLIENLDKEFADAANAAEADDENDGDDADDVVVEKIVYLEDGKEVGREEPEKDKPDQEPKPGKPSKDKGPTFRLELVRRLHNWEQFVQRTGYAVNDDFLLHDSQIYFAPLILSQSY